MNKNEGETPPLSLLGQLHFCKWGQQRKLLLLALVLALLAFIPLRLAMTFYRVPQPQAILVLDGSPDRIEFAGQFWHSHQNLDIWISGSSYLTWFYRDILPAAGVALEQIYYGICATDTVTNFTCLVDDLQGNNLRHLYLITSDYHLPRARAIAALVLGSRGIVVTPVAVPSTDRLPESPLRIARDCLRSVVWMVTGHTGASLKPGYKQLKSQFFGNNRSVQDPQNPLRPGV